MIHQLITAPTEEPVSLDEAKAQCEVALDDSTRDGLLETLIVAARQWTESYVRRGLCTQTWDFLADEFPCAGEALELPLTPVQSITHVKYLDEAGAEQTWSSVTGYDIHGADTTPSPQQERAFIVPKYGQIWPVPQLVPGAVRIRAVVGYGAPEAVPGAIKQGILLKIAELFAQREPTLTGTSWLRTGTEEALLGPFRSLRVA